MTWKICFSYNQFNLLSRKQLKIDDQFEDFKAYFSNMLFYYTHSREGESTLLPVFEALSIQNNSGVVGKAVD